MISIRKFLALGALAAVAGLVDARPAQAQTPAPSPMVGLLSLGTSPGGLTLTATTTGPSGGVPALTPVAPKPSGNTIFN